MLEPGKTLVVTLRNGVGNSGLLNSKAALDFVVCNKVRFKACNKATDLTKVG